MPIFKVWLERAVGVALVVADNEKKAREIIEEGLEADFVEVDYGLETIRGIEDQTEEFNEDDLADLVEKQRQKLENHGLLSLMPREAQRRVQLLARVTVDGYLLGCTDNFENGWSERFWSDYYEEGPFQKEGTEPEIILIEVPKSMKEALLAMGTSGQTYIDGYQAWQNVLNVKGYKGKD